ncbi:3-oxoacyl-[acyl-carrier-protein] synthase III C-terminal domain-containing protein [Amycolatopsis silviterrae]|uniref:3-oxoacyl-[acyl-carrier-protein] synthase III C-terminal domain-containing protein n=1 Tax=Amycolatopsis silviterrae TaxID=1656914 RepID=A0ABW5H478_9PSEU
MPHQPLYLRGLAYSVGDAVPLADIEDGDPEQVQIFTKLGLRDYRKSPLGLSELCRRSAAETMRTSGAVPADVGAVLIAPTVNSIHAVGLDYPEVAQILGDHGLSEAKLYGVTLSKCSNLSAALELGASLLRANDYSEVLIIVGDKCARDRDRFMDSAESILSDGALSFVLSKNGGDWELAHLATSSDLSHLTRDFGVLAFVDNSVKNLGRLWRAIPAELPGEKMEKVFCGNYNMLIQRALMKELGTGPEKFWLDNLARLGHVFSCDVLINLTDYAERTAVAPGAAFACLTVGYFRWGCFVLRKC